MKLGIMQPYFFPYIGYWQLMNAVDTYVVYDDVNYIKGGWINRNRILINGQPQFLTVPIIKASSNSLINELEIDHSRGFPDKHLKTLEMNYKRAPFFEDVMPILEKTLSFNSENLALSLYNSLKTVSEYLGIQTKLVFSSALQKENSLKGKDKVLAICKLLNAEQYYNAIGGKDLYDKNEFLSNDISLRFLKTGNIAYNQFDKDFVPNLSIIDMIMHVSQDDIRNKLKQFTLE